MPRIQLLIPAAGSGRRLGAAEPKARFELKSKPLLVWTLSRFVSIGLANRAVLVVPPGQETQFGELLRPFFPDPSFQMCAGGEERQHSVARGLAALDADTEIVVIHDAARPFVAAESILESIDAAQTYGASTVALPSVDTILRSDTEAFLVDTPDRATMWSCQTPQTFRVDVIRAAHAEAERAGYVGTDDASLVRRLGHPVKLVRGTKLNIKVTTPDDVCYANYLIESGLV